jgi:predicted TIM-barrel fold metal-dependent hydrolase
LPGLTADRSFPRGDSPGWGAAGIDFHVISRSAPSARKLDVESAARMAPLVNDRLHAAIGAHPTRFGGFATIATPDPKAAARSWSVR